MSNQSLEEILGILDKLEEVKTEIENDEKKLWDEIKEGVNFFGKISKYGKRKKNIKIPEFSFIPKPCTKGDNTLMYIQKTMPTNPKQKAKEEQQTFSMDKNALKKWDFDEPISNIQYFEPGSNFKISLNKNDITEECANGKNEDSYSIKEDETIKASDSLTVTSLKRTSRSLTNINELPNKKSKKDLSLSSDQLNVEDCLKPLQPQEQNVLSSSCTFIRRSQRTMAQKKEMSVLASSIKPTKSKIKKINQLQPSSKPGSSKGIKKKLTPGNEIAPITAIPVKTGIKKPQQTYKEQASQFKQQKMKENLRTQELASRAEEKEMENVDDDNYGILDIEENDTTTEKITTWAKRENLLFHLIHQQGISQELLSQYFAIPSKTPNLRKMFGKHTMERVRTSSAVWPSPE